MSLPRYDPHSRKGSRTPVTVSELKRQQHTVTGVPGSRAIALFISLLCGGTSVLAFAPFAFWPVLLPCVGTLFVLVFYAGSARYSFTIGYVFGLGLFGAGVYWVYYSLHLFGAAIAPLAAVGTLLCVMVLSLYPALFAVIAWRFRVRGSGLVHRSSWFLVAAPALWLLVEWFRSWFLTGFPWLSIGYSTINTPLAGYAPIGGVFLNSLLMAFCGGALALIYVQRSIASACIALLGIVVVAGGGQMLRSVSWTQPAGDPVQVTMVQGNISQELKFQPRLLEDSLRIYSDLSLTGADLIIWPESAIPTLFTDVEAWQTEFVEEMAARGSTVLSGGFHANEDYTEYYNAIKVLGGTDDQLYTKRHLVPFGEFIPLRDIIKLLAQVITIPMSDLTPGTGPIMPINIDGVNYGMSICYEDAFGNEMIAQMPQTNVLVNISNDAWFGDSTAPHQHQEIAAMRSLEFDRPMLRVTNTGITSLISRHGQVLEQGEQFEAMAMDVEVVPRHGSTPYVLVGNWLVVSVGFFLVFVYFVCFLRAE